MSELTQRPSQEHRESVVI